MRLRNKLLIVLTVMWAGFLTLMSLVYPLQLLDFILVNILFAALLCLVLYRVINNKIENFIMRLKSFDVKPPYDTRLRDNDSYETKFMSTNINKILQHMQFIYEDIEHQIEEKTQNIHKKNIQLQQEISDRISLERKMAIHRETITRLAHYDNLTSLPNRIFFNEILNKAMNHAKRHGKILAILIVDIDQFESINQQMGHSGGDFVLKELASRFTSVLRAEDILARSDGDEFAILLNDIGKPKFASTVAEKIMAICKQAMRIESKEIQLTASIGISVYPNDAKSLEELITNADQALAQAKKAGGDNYIFYSKSIGDEAQEFIELGAALKKAVKNNELMLYYQPKLNLRRGHVTSVEALIRWLHPSLGFVPANKLISVAEDSGLINEIGEWALREACRMNKHWQEEGYEHLTIAVNLSPKQFHQNGIANIVAKILTETGLNPRYLELEINETTIMDDIEKSAAVLQQLKSVGVMLSIDHFGVGYTSISQLKQFPISILKIDNSFIKGIPQNPNDNAIVNAFIALGHNLGLEVIAEGVETAEQVQYLAIQNCDMVQGYFLSHPLPAQKIISQFSKLRDEVLI